MGESILKLTGIAKSFAGVRALKGVDFDLLAGEVHALVGENGAGKSTLIKVITGAHAPDEGTLEVRGEAIPANDPVLARSLGIAAIYQQPALFPDLTVAENIAIGLEPPGAWRRVRWGARRRRARELLARVGAAIDPEEEVRNLAMPEQQLVEIARALGADARILIMDEPSASLTDREVDSLFRVVADLKASGVGIIYISHRLEELPRVADRVTALRDGALVGTRSMAEVDRTALIRMMVGRELSSVFPKVEVPIGEVVLEAKGLNCRASGVRDVSFQVRQGEMLGLAGLIGSGRTELARVLFGLTPADSGTIVLDGEPIAIGSPGEAVEAGIAYVPEDRRRHGVVPEMSVACNATLATLDRIATLGMIDFGRERSAATDLVAKLGVKTASIESPVGDLSGGNQQKVALGRWLASDPTVLILDEPTQGVDVGAKAEIHRLMGELASRGMAIVMISSELPEILGMSDRVAVMHGGTIVGTLDRADATQEAILGLALGHPAGGGVMIARHGRTLRVAAAYLALLAILAVFAPRFYRIEQWRAFAVGNASLLVAAVGMTLVIVARQIDISIGSQFSLCAVASGLLARAGLPMPLVAAGTLLIGAVLGGINGGLVAGLGLPSIVVTLATLVIGREGLRYLREGEFVRDLPGDFQWFGLGQGAGQWLVVSVAILVFAAVAWSSRNLAAGRAVFAAGSDPEAARLAGIRPRRVVFAVFVAMGALTGLAALLGAAQFPAVDPKGGTGLEMQVIAAVVVGGASVSGGRGSLIGTLVGVLLLGTINPALVYLGTSPEWEKAIQGAIILLAVASDGLSRGAR